MDLKILVWNVEHFTGRAKKSRQDRLSRVIKYLGEENPDIFALIEVVGDKVFRELTLAFPTYQFFITEGDQSQEILIGIRGGLSAFVTQRNEFKRSNPFLRPGALVSLRSFSGETLILLFTHLKSLPSPEGFGLRDAMISKVRNLKIALEKKLEKHEKLRFILLGDLNTQGLNLTFSENDLSSSGEIDRLRRMLSRSGLFWKQKSAKATFFGGSESSYPPSDLDHVFATEGVEFAPQGDGDAVIRVGGWADEKDDAAIDDWIDAYSDHAPLIMTIRNL